jgi:hypothetical protein
MNDKKQSQKSSSSLSQEEEMDLGHLFTLIGRGFSNFFNFIGLILKTIAKWLLHLILFLRYNFKKLILGAIIGVLLGGIYQYGIKDIKYESSMTVQPNFGSAVQLYKNIDYYESLVKQEDFERLASSFDISQDEAESISSIEVEPYSNDNQIILSYKNFIEYLDTTTVKLIDYETFAKAQPVESFRYHIITVTSKNKYLFNKLEVPIMTSIIQNKYYDKVKSTAYSNLISRKNALEGSMIELDSLRLLYKKVLLAESEKESSGTNIFMSDLSLNNKEVVIFDKYMAMNQQLIEVNKKLTEENEVINVVSSFNSIGMKVKGWYRNFAIVGLLTGFILVFFIISAKEINKLLVAYENSE